MATIKSIEQKAKAYDEAIKMAQRFYNNSVAITKKGLEDIFPELAESEDERIRKELLHFVQNERNCIDSSVKPENSPKLRFLIDAIAWLEKQGGHAKFINGIQVGDKVTRNEDGVLVNLSQLNRVAKKDEKQGEQPKKHDVCDYCDQQGSCISPCPMKLVEKQGGQKPKELFDIPENGIENDVSVTSRLEHIPEQLKPIAKFILDYAHWNLHKDEWNHPVPEVPLFRVLDALVQEGKPYQGCDSCIEQKPVENILEDVKKNWRDYFKPQDVTDIYNEGFKDGVASVKPVEWSNTDENTLLDTINTLRSYGRCSTDRALWLMSLKGRVQPQLKQEWSEEDDNYRKDAIRALHDYRKELTEEFCKVPKWDGCIDWLKSLKDRCLPQPKQEWSEEDATMLNDCVCAIQAADEVDYNIEDKAELIGWLKSLRPQKQWKPSESDIIILEQVIDGTANPINYHATLHAILEKLKKLREE